MLNGVDLLAQLAHDVDHNQAIPTERFAIALLKAKISYIPNILQSPAPDVEILTFNLAGPVLAVRPYCNNAHYWQVYFDTNKAIRETFGEAGYPVPEKRYTVNSLSQNPGHGVIPNSPELG